MLIVGLCLFLLQLCKSVEAQSLPPNNCESVFRYERQGNQWIGRLTPDRDGLTSIDWTIVFTAHGTGGSATVSGLMPYPDKETALQNMRNGGRGESYLTFQNYGNELPKVTRVDLNGQTMCTASEYSAPSSTMTRQNHLAVSTTSTQTRHRTNTQPSVPSIQTWSVPTATGSSFEGFFRNNLFLNDVLREHIGSVGFSRNDDDATKISFDLGGTSNQPAPDECGVEGFVGLLHGGENVPRGRFPWMTALYHNETPDPKAVNLVYKCVATLVSARTVITAAHCIYGVTPENMRIYVGRHDLETHPESGATLMAVESVRTHPDFVGNLVPDTDVGLLVLSTQVQWSTYVRPICMWSSSIRSVSAEQGAVAGWGFDESAKLTRFPKTTTVRTVSREVCLREMISAKDFLTPRTLCAGNSQRQGPCLGDSGGSLMIEHNGRWMVRGIVSLAQRSGGNCDLSRYVIYCDVARHLSWIERNIVR